MIEDKKKRIIRRIDRPKRTETISIKVYKEEYDSIYTGASNEGMSISEFVRTRVLNSIEKGDQA